MSNTSIIIPSWNGKNSLSACFDALRVQSKKANLILVDNGSTDGSAEFVEKNFPGVTILRNEKNLGFAGGVNSGIKQAIETGAEYVALLNNDAVADKDWLKHLVNFLDCQPAAGIVTSKIVSSSKTKLDSTGECYTIWGLPYPRGRGETDIDKYDQKTWVFGASGGASLYRLKMLEEIGLFDEDFFAYYEDVDISFRAQLAGWKVGYEPRAVAYHEIGATSNRIKNFTTYQTLKNLRWLMWKNVPWALIPRVWPRFTLAYLGFIIQALKRGQFGPLFKGLFVGGILMPKKFWQRHQIQKNRKVSIEYIASIITPDLPPNASRLRSMRARWWRLTRRPDS